jgi:hypothetical protein
MKIIYNVEIPPKKKDLNYYQNGWVESCISIPNVCKEISTYVHSEKEKKIID